MAEMHQLLAALNDARSRTAKFLDEARNTFKNKTELFRGGTKTLTMVDEAKASENGIVEQSVVQTTVEDKLEYVWEELVRFLDCLIQAERTDQTANADIVVEEETIIENVPAACLLTLDKHLKNIRSMYDSIPTLPSGVDWTEDPDRHGVYISPEIKTRRTEKTIKPVILTPATDKHPAQVDKIPVDETIGIYLTRHKCSLITSGKKAEWLKRIDMLITATAQALAKANSATVVDGKMGKQIMDFIHK